MKSVICAIVKNEQRFIREWVEYYLSIGFEKIYIFEDFGSDSHKEMISNLIDEGKVELTPLSEGFIEPQRYGTMVQKNLYKKFFFKCKEEHLADWVGFFDVDEFLMFDEGYDLSRLEEEFKDYGGVLLSWRNYGASGHLKRPEGGVLENYTIPAPEGTLLDRHWQWNVKSLVNVKNCPGMNHIHWFKGCKQPDMTDEGHLVFEKAWINHYYTKSWEDYLDRIFSRGNMQNNYRCLDKFFNLNPDLMPMKEKMVNEQRYRHAASTMWISRDMKIISGGNVNKLREINGWN